MIIKICKHHGELTIEKITKRKECRLCCRISAKKNHINNYEKNKHKWAKKKSLYAIAWAKRNPEKKKLAEKKYLENNKEKVKETARKSSAKRRKLFKEEIYAIDYKKAMRSTAELKDFYIKNKLAKKFNIKQKDVPLWMIPVYREIFKLKRKIREKNET